MASEGGAPVAIVTGGSAGIGKAIARSLHEGGYHVIITGRDRARAEAAAAEISAEGRPGIIPIPVDAGNAGDMRGLVSEIASRHERLDVLVNNAGFGELIPIAKTTEAAMEQAFRINVFGPATAIAAAWPMFERQRSGCIVNISSMAALDPFPGFFLYAAAKSALNSLTRSAWAEGRARGIRAFTIGPGAVETRLLRSMFTEKVVPPAASLSPNDIADLALECISGRRDIDAGRCLYIRRDAGSGTIIVERESDARPR